MPDGSGVRALRPLHHSPTSGVQAPSWGQALTPLALWLFPPLATGVHVGYTLSP